MVTLWILNSISRDLADSLQYVNDSRELLQELEDRYDQTNGAKLYQLQKEINNLTHESLNITNNYTKMKRLWEELRTLNAHTSCTCQCNCGAKAEMVKAKQDRHLIQFLMGLNEVYTIVRGNILMMNPLPNLSQCFSILIQEEKQREVTSRQTLDLGSTSLNAHGIVNAGFRTNYQGNRQGSNPYNRQNGKQQQNQHINSITNYNNAGPNGYRGQKNNYNSNKPHLFCDYCKKTSHTEDKCYRLHGFPQDFKFTKVRQSASASNMHGGCFESTGSLGGEMPCQDGNKLVSANYQLNNRDAHSLSKEQYDQLVKLLNHFQPRDAGQSSSSITSGAVNFAG